MERIRRFLVSLAVLIFVNTIMVPAVCGQLVTSTRVATITAADFNLRMRTAYPNTELEQLRGALNLYKITYRSVDV